MDSSWGKRFTENPAEKHPAPEPQSRAYDSEYSGAKASAQVQWKETKLQRESLPSLCDDSQGAPTEPSHMIHPQIPVQLHQQHTETLTLASASHFAVISSLFLYTSLFALTFHVPSAEMLLPPNIHVAHSLHFLESLLRCIYRKFFPAYPT